MRMTGTESWQIRQGTELAVDLALYIRDTLALSVSTEPDIPLLEPSVPVFVPDNVDRAAVTREWPEWWAEVLASVAGDESRWYENYPSRAESPVLRDRPGIRMAMRAFEATAGRHFAETHRRAGMPRPTDLDMGYLVQAREAELGRRAEPFTLVITELTVAARFSHRQAPHHLLMSTRLLRDIPRRDAVLRDVIAELA